MHNGLKICGSEIHIFPKYELSEDIDSTMSLVRLIQDVMLIMGWQERRVIHNRRFCAYGGTGTCTVHEKGETINGER